MQINTFNGGISIKTSAFLIPVDASIVYQDVDPLPGSLKPCKTDTYTGISSASKFIRAFNTWYSNSASTQYVVYGDKIIMDNTQAPYTPLFYDKDTGGSAQRLGIPTPSQAPIILPTIPVAISFGTDYLNIVVSESFGTPTTGTHWYMYRFTPVWGGEPVTLFSSIPAGGGNVTLSIPSLTSAYSSWSVFRSPAAGSGVEEIKNGILYRDWIEIYTGTALSVIDNFTQTQVTRVGQTLNGLSTTVTEKYKIVTKTNGVISNIQYQEYKPVPNPVTPWKTIVFTYFPAVANTTLYKYVTIETSKDTYRTGYVKCKELTYSGYMLDTCTYDVTDWLYEPTSLDFSYCYTYYSSLYGWESAPSPILTSTYSLGNPNIYIYAGALPTLPNYVDTVRFYRLGGDYTDFMYIGGGSVYSVGGLVHKPYIPLGVGNTVLSSQYNTPAPAYLTNLAEANSMIFGSVGTKLHYSDIAYIYAWSEYNFIEFDDTITGIGAVANGLLVFTKDKTYIVTGTSPTTLSKYLVSAQYGCLAHSTIQFINGTLVWLSDDGLCASSGSNIQLMTYEKLGIWTPVGPYASIVFNNTYYLTHSQGTTCIQFDTLKVYNLGIWTTCFGISNNVLYYVSYGYLYSVATGGSLKSLSYQSPKYSDGSVSTLKNYKTVYTYSSGELFVTVMIDDIAVLVSYELNEGHTELKLPQGSRLGYHIRFIVNGTGTLHEIEYKVEGRQNGR